MFGTGKRYPSYFLVSASIAGIIFLSITASGCRSKPAPQASYVQGVAEKGAALFYGDKHCGICHAVNGSGGRTGPDLSGKRPSPPAVGWLVSLLWNHQPGMWQQMRGSKSPYPVLNQEEMADMLAFLYQAETADAPGDMKAGERAFTDKGCVRCHAVRGAGGNTAPDLSTGAAAGGSINWTTAMWNHAQSMVDPITKELGQWPQFTAAEMNNLYAFARGSSPGAHKQEVRGSADRGSQLFQKDCIQCHSVGGEGGAGGPGLGPETDLPLSPAQFSGVLWNHAPAMMKRIKEKGMEVPKLDTGGLSDLLAFLASLRYVEPPGTPEAGKRIFADRGCASCHGPNGEGGTKNRALPAKTYTAVSFAAALWSHGPKMQARAEEIGLTWPVLQAGDVGNLVSFLSASKPSR